MRSLGTLGLSIMVAMMVASQPRPSVAESKIGVASATKNQVQGIVGGGTRALSAGSELFSNETVRTGDASLAQLLFLDETSLSVGARSEVKLDRFVYNPDRKAGNVVLEASRGAFRFISGSQNPSNYTIKTPLATIGVRGTIFHWDIYEHREDGYVLQGQVIVDTALGHFVLNAGDGVSLSANGAIQKVRWAPTDFDSSGLKDPGLIQYPSPEDRDLRNQLDAIELRGRPLPPPPNTGGLGIR